MDFKFGFFVCNFFFLAVLASEDFKMGSTKIVGGSPAEEGQFPYQVSLRRGNRHFCGGSILGKKWILTAAHCLVSFEPSEIQVIAGSNMLNESGDSYQAVELIPHERFNSYLIRNDIGLIAVDKDVVLGDKVQAVKLADTYSVPANSCAVLSGWGTTSYPGQIPNELQFINLRVIEQGVCENVSFRVTKKNVCTLNQEGEGACHGDSGGPLVADGRQIGVVSWGKPCAKGQPDVFTRVYSYLHWIERVMKNTDDEKPIEIKKFNLNLL